MTFKLKRGVAWLFGVIFLFPFVFIVLLSFMQRWPYPQLWPYELTIENWLLVFSAQSGLIESFGLSVFISLSVAFFATLCGFFTSKSIAYHRHRPRLMLLSYFPFILSPVVYAGCIYFFFIKLGWSGNVWSVILAQLIIAYPYAIIIFSGFWSARVQSMQQLSATLGANRWQTFRRVLFPAAKGMMLVVFFQTYLISWFEYGLTAIIGVGKVQTLTINVFQYINQANHFYAALAACLLILPPAVLLYINKRFVFRTHQ